MGFLSKLGTVAKLAGGIGGAPFTGGASLIPMLMETAGGVMGGMAEGAAKGRTDTNAANAERDRINASVYGTQQGAASNMAALKERAAMERANLGITAPVDRSKQIVRGSLMQNLQPFKIGNVGSKVKVPTVSGGLTPAALSAMVRQGGGELQSQALGALLNKSDIPKEQDYDKAMVAAPKLSELAEPGKLESMGSILGPILKGLGQVSKGTGQPPIMSGGAGGQVPTPYGGRDQYGNPTDFTLARPGMAPTPTLNARQNLNIAPYARG
jgi:hypothetical protein